MKHATVSTPITPQSVDALCSNLERGPLPPYGQVTIGCLGCGKQVTVTAGQEHDALTEMQDHARRHQNQLAKVHNNLLPDDLIAVMAWGMAAEKRQN